MSTIFIINKKKTIYTVYHNIDQINNIKSKRNKKVHRILIKKKYKFLVI